MSEVLQALNVIATVAAGAAIFVRIGRFLERQERQEHDVADHEKRIRAIEIGGGGWG
jgi:hypothetical protein